MPVSRCNWSVQGLIHFQFDKEPTAHLVPGCPFEPTGTPRPWVPISTAGAGRPEPLADLDVQFKKHLWPAKDLLAAIREDRPPLCSAEEARWTIEMIMAVFESHRQDGRRVTWPLPQRDNPLARL